MRLQEQRQDITSTVWKKGSRVILKKLRNSFLFRDCMRNEFALQSEMKGLKCFPAAALTVQSKIWKAANTHSGAAQITIARTWQQNLRRDMTTWSGKSMFNIRFRVTGRIGPYIYIGHCLPFLPSTPLLLKHMSNTATDGWSSEEIGRWCTVLYRNTNQPVCSFCKFYRHRHIDYTSDLMQFYIVKLW